MFDVCSTLVKGHATFRSLTANQIPLYLAKLQSNWSRLYTETVKSTAFLYLRDASIPTLICGFAKSISRERKLFMILTLEELV